MMANEQRQRERQQERAKRAVSLMIHLPMAVLAGGLTVCLFYWCTPNLQVSQVLLALRAQTTAVEKKIRDAKADARAKPGDAETHARLVALQKEATVLAEKKESHGLQGAYWVKLIIRDESTTETLNVWVLHAILGTLFVVVFYCVVIMLARSFPGCRLVGMARANCRFRSQRMAQLEKKWKQTRNADAVRAENETLSAMDESRVVVGLIPIQACEWLSPTLGFIGTVVGISSAIGSLQLGIQLVFAEGDLTGSALRRFNEGFAGLGMAFDTTFFGLLGLGFAGLTAFVLRRRAMAAISAIDAACDEWISDLPDDSWKEFKKHHDDSAKFRKWVRALAEKTQKQIDKTGQALGGRLLKLLEWLEQTQKQIDEKGPALGERLQELAEWLEKEVKPGLNKEFQENPGFRAWVIETLPKLLSDTSHRRMDGLAKVVKEAESRLTGRVDAYGEILSKLSSLIAGDVRYQRLLLMFVLDCVRTAGATRDDPFWRKLEETLLRPLREAPQMTLVTEASGRPVDCIAVSAVPYTLAVASRDPSGDSHIGIHSIDMIASGYESSLARSVKTFEVMAEVDALAFNRSGSRLAYLLQDGAVGVLDLRTSEASETTLDGGVVSKNSLTWWHEGGERLLVPLSRGDGTELMSVDFGANGHNGSPQSIRMLGGFNCEAIVVGQSRRCVILAGTEVDGGTPTVQLIPWQNGQFGEPRMLPMDGIRGSVTSLSFAAPDEEEVLCGMSDGTLARIPLEAAASATFMRLGLDAPVMLATSDDRGDKLAVCGAGVDRISLLLTWADELGEIGPQIRGHGPFAASTVSPNRRVVAVGGQDGHTAVWEFPTHLV